MKVFHQLWLQSNFYRIVFSAPHMWHSPVGGGWCSVHLPSHNPDRGWTEAQKVAETRFISFCGTEGSGVGQNLLRDLRQMSLFKHTGIYLHWFKYFSSHDDYCRNIDTFFWEEQFCFITAYNAIISVTLGHWVCDITFMQDLWRCTIRSCWSMLRSDFTSVTTAWGLVPNLQ